MHAVNDMLGNGGQKSQVKGAILTDEEFDDIQRRHYGTGSQEAGREIAYGVHGGNLCVPSNHR